VQVVRGEHPQARPGADRGGDPGLVSMVGTLGSATCRQEADGDQGDGPPRRASLGHARKVGLARNERPANLSKIPVGSP